MTDAERLEAAHLGTLSNATFVERARTTVRFALPESGYEDAVTVLAPAVVDRIVRETG